MYIAIVEYWGNRKLKISIDVYKLSMVIAGFYFTKKQNLSNKESVYWFKNINNSKGTYGKQIKFSTQ